MRGEEMRVRERVSESESEGEGQSEDKKPSIVVPIVVATIVPEPAR